MWTLDRYDESNTWKRVAIVPNFFEKIKEIKWKPHSFEFVVNCVDGSARGWRLQQQQELDKVSAVLIWSIGHTALEASGAVITEAVGLSEINRNLLKQRGAIDESAPSILSLESQKFLDLLTQRDPSEPLSLSDTDEWQWEEDAGSEAYFSEEEEEEEDVDKDDEEKKDERSDSE
ncbi:hypothetical protein BGZ96_010192 [Linnemannia gamsii]|uniref:Uncharacterized protein n=1 Tax=Linnemannia gamsii TaxID=64522 RepID=A0ABQ7JVK3_9FUNG|nr:hypothetical protein BGZ96_010192 [Linnemannia gamsii]